MVAFQEKLKNMRWMCLGWAKNQVSCSELVRVTCYYEKVKVMAFELRLPMKVLMPAWEAAAV